MIWAPIDSRFTSIFHDVRQESTFVHHEDGFDLPASETPSRLTMSLKQWLPARYVAWLGGPRQLNEPSTEKAASRITTNHEGLMDP